MQQIYRRKPMPKWDFNKVAKHRKFSAYFQNTFSQEHLWTAASENSYLKEILKKGYDCATGFKGATNL